MCDRVGDGILGFMSADADNWGYLFDATTGAMTPAFARELCALPCANSGGSVSCADIVFNFTSASGDTQLVITFGGTNISTGDTWILYRSLTAGTFTDPSIASGTFTGSNGSYTNTGLVNGTAYFYKLVVSRSGCSDESVQTQQPGWKPAACLSLGSTLIISSSPIDSGVWIRLQGRSSSDYIPNGTAFQVYRSTQPDAQGDEIFSGTLPGDFGCTGENGLTALCLKDTSPQLVLGVTYYYTVVVTQSGCSSATFTASSQRGTSGGGTSSIVMVAGCSDNEHQTTGIGSSNVAIVFAGLPNVQYYILYATSVKYGFTVNSKITGTPPVATPGVPHSSSISAIYSYGGNSGNTATMAQVRAGGPSLFPCLNNGALVGTLDAIFINGAWLTAELANAALLGGGTPVGQDQFYGTDITYTLAPYYFTGGEGGQSPAITVPLT